MKPMNRHKRSEPLSGHQAVAAPWRQSLDTMMPFSLGYFKAKTRVTVLMAMLALARDIGCDNYAEAMVVYKQLIDPSRPVV